MTTDLAPALRGRGYACGHHGEILQGIIEDATVQRMYRVLVTMPCQEFRSIATFKSATGQLLEHEEGWRSKSLAAARLTLEWLGAPTMGGRISIESNIPTGRGLGSSTADVTASIRAVADAFCVVLTPQVTARISVQAEVASDPVMFNDQAVLFAQREAVALEYFGSPLPMFDVLSLHLGDSDHEVKTLEMPLPSYSRWEVATYRSLLGLLRHGIQRGDAAMIARVATVSATINQRFLPKPLFTEILTLMSDSSALGLQVAHSGTVVGILFREGDVGDARRLQSRLRAGLGLESSLFGSSRPLELAS